MEYALLIYGDESQAQNASPEELEAGMDVWRTYETWLAEKGIKVSGEALHDTSQATTVRVQDGDTLTTDGPFAEVKELIGGFAILRASSKAEAIKLGRRFMKVHQDALGPNWEGELEIRQVFDASDFAPGA